MEASVKFREEQKPLFRAEMPLDILGFSFQSGIVAGESEELSFILTIFFESGPSLKMAYFPNDSLNPFSLILKTGTGQCGSPIASPLNIRAEFNFGGRKPSFFLHFKPHLGDLIVKKVQSSVLKKQIIVDLRKKISYSLSESPAVVTAAPLRKNATLTFRWGVGVPATEDSSMVLMKMKNSLAGISLKKLPCLFINKNRKDDKVRPARMDAAESCLFVKKQLEMIQAENGALKNAMDNLKGVHFNRMKITQAENRASKEAVDYLYRQFTSSKVFRLVVRGCLTRVK